MYNANIKQNIEFPFFGYVILGTVFYILPVPRLRIDMEGWEKTTKGVSATSQEDVVETAILAGGVGSKFKKIRQEEGRRTKR